MIKVVAVTQIKQGLYAVALSIPGLYRQVRAIVRDGDSSVWIDALNSDVRVYGNGGAFEFAAE